MKQAKITLEQLQHIASNGVSLIAEMKMVVEAVEPGIAVIRVPFREQLLRSGGTIAGPVLMAVADFAMYGAVLSLIGPNLTTATSHLGIDFLRRSPPQDVIAAAEILKLGRRLAVGTIAVRSSAGEIVAHANCTYALPSEYLENSPPDWGKGG